MKIRKKFAAMLLSVCMVLTLLPAGALATAATTSGTITIHGSSTYSAYPVFTFSGVSSIASTGTYAYTDPTVSSQFKTPTVIAAINTAIGSSLSATSPTLDNDFASAFSKLADNSAAVASLAETLQGVTSKPSATSLPANSKTTVPYGYYLIVDNGGSANIVSRPILVGVPFISGSTLNNDVTVNVKPATANLTKKIQVDGIAGGDNKSNMNPTMLVDSNTTVKDSAVYYRTLSDFPAYSSDAKKIVYTVTDTMSQGLTFGDIDSVDIVSPHTDYDESHPDKFDVITPLNANDSTLGYTLLKPTVSNNETQFTITLSGSNMDSKIINWGANGYKLMIRYHVTLKANSLSGSKINVGSTGNPNSANLTYSYKPGGGSDTKQTKDDTVITYTNQLIITKTDASDSSKKLIGATFGLYRADSSGAFGPTPDDQQTTDGSGVATFNYLQQGTYQLKELVAPSGYNTLQSPITFTVGATNTSNKIKISNTTIVQDQIGNADASSHFLADWSNSHITSGIPGDIVVDPSSGTLTIPVQDNAGFVLPGTGGIGTTIFFASGIAILLLGGCLAFVYTRKKRTGSHFQH